MEVLLETLTQFAVEFMVIILGTLLSVALNKVKGYFNTLKKKDELGIIDAITDLCVQYSEAELKNSKGLEKRDFAVDRALEILASKGIKGISREEVIAGIENGVQKLKNK